MGRTYGTEPGDTPFPARYRLEPADPSGLTIGYGRVLRVAFDDDADEGWATVTHEVPDTSGMVRPGGPPVVRTEDVRAAVRVADAAAPSPAPVMEAAGLPKAPKKAAKPKAPAPDDGPATFD
jgi:hypothetical protein